jgi:hypothetical protein
MRKISKNHLNQEIMTQQAAEFGEEQKKILLRKKLSRILRIEIKTDAQVQMLLTRYEQLAERGLIS